MLESDASRLAMIKSLGGQRVLFRGEEFWALFDNAFTDISGMVEGTTPALSVCRSSDIERLKITKEDTLDVAGEQWRVKMIEPDGTGVSVVRLKK
jgi:N-glycosylase/DNA lyase